AAPAAAGAVAVTAGSTTYLVGGAGAAGVVRTVTAAGNTRVVARLPVPVGDPAATIADGQIWVFGGETARGPVNVIQRVSLAGRGASIADTLPGPSAGASAFALNGVIFVAGGYTPSPGRLNALYPNLLTGGRADAPGVLAAAARSTSGQVLRFDPASGTVSVAADLPMPVARAGVAVIGSTAYLVGGSDGPAPMPSVVTLRMVPAARALPGSLANRGPLAAPWLAPAHGPGHLAPGSNPAALPADVLVADHLNNRLIIIDPHGRVRWTFPRPGDLAPGQTFKVPDDAFFSPDGRYIVATQENNQVISVISIARHRIVYRYGRPGTPGTGPNRLDNPDDAMLLPGGDILAADIKNCRILLLAPPAHRPARVIGQTTHACLHAPPQRFGSPNGAFPLTDGRYLVTEINGDWASSMGLNGHVLWSTHPPGVAYPSDTNEVFPGRYLTADYSPSGQVVEFSRTGRLLWRFGGLNQPSLAEPLPNGDVLVNDDFNDRIIVIDPATNRIVWQYGHTGVAGRAPGYLNDPDGLDLVPPYSMLIRHAATAGRP
ncbi:MAG: outer membrane protein assembly factor BamB family protein, partial [Streptosporangiaceae bacterium]